MQFALYDNVMAMKEFLAILLAVPHIGRYLTSHYRYEIIVLLNYITFMLVLFSLKWEKDNGRCAALQDLIFF